MGFTLAGLLLLAHADGFGLILIAAAPARLRIVSVPPGEFAGRADGLGRAVGLAQSVFQVGGNTGSALGPLLAAFIVLPHGQSSIAWFSAAALLAIAVLAGVGRWYGGRARGGGRKRGGHGAGPALSRRRIAGAIAVLMLLIFSKYFYLASLNNYFTFYLIAKFHLSVQAAQIHLFIFLAAVAVGTLLGGPIGDRIGRKYVIWGSILGVLPFTLMLP